MTEVDRRTAVIICVDAGVTKFASALLNSWGYEVHAFDFAWQVVQFADDYRRIDLLVCDMRLASGITGPRLVLCVIPPRPHTGVVLLGDSGETIDSAVDASILRALGCVILPKPFGATDLHCAVEASIAAVATGRNIDTARPIITKLLFWPPKRKRLTAIVSRTLHGIRRLPLAIRLPRGGMRTGQHGK